MGLTHYSWHAVGLFWYLDGELSRAGSTVTVTRAHLLIMTHIIVFQITPSVCVCVCVQHMHIIVCVCTLTRRSSLLGVRGAD